MKVFKRVSGALPVNSYFILNEVSGEGFVIDPGIDAEGTLKFAKEKGITLTCALLTHTHFDHATCAYDLQQAGVKIYVSREEEVGLRDDRYNLSKHFYIDFEPLFADKTFGDGDEFVIADIVVKAIATPGHSIGSTCFIIGDNLFTGDTLMCCTIGRDDLYLGDGFALMQSLKKITSLTKNYNVYAGHGEDSTLDYEKVNNPYLA